MTRQSALARMRSIDPAAVDFAFALALTALALAGSLLREPGDPYKPATLLGTILILGQTLPLAVRRRYPVPVLIVTGVSTALHAMTGERSTAATLGVLFALYTVAAHTDFREAVESLIATMVGILISFGIYLATLTTSPFVLVEQIATNFVIFGVAWLLGRIMRSRREFLGELLERNRQLEEEREENARLAVADERARIARELHDIVGHQLSVITVQATAARRALEARGDLDGPNDPARIALDAVETTGRETLAEMRRMLGLLRTDADDAPGDRTPQPGLEQLDDLLGQVRDAGLPVSLVVEGERRPLPAGVDLSAYRIIQEALTNTLRHAGRASATVLLRFGERDVEIEVVDDGQGAVAALVDAGSRGHGLMGMSERAALVGGTLEAGPRVSGGFAVTSRLPLDPSPP